MAHLVKALVALLLLAVLLGAGLGRPPRRRPAPRALAALILGSLALDAVGAFAGLLHRSGLALLTIACGVLGCALAAWLSRAEDEGEDGPSPTEPVPAPGPDWSDFDAARRRWERVGSRR